MSQLKQEHSFSLVISTLYIFLNLITISLENVFFSLTELLYRSEAEMFQIKNLK